MQFNDSIILTSATNALLWDPPYVTKNLGKLSSFWVLFSDLFIIVSGSGSTEHLKILAEKAKSTNAQVVLLTTKPESPIGKLANSVIELPAGTKYDAEGSAQPLGTLFEQATQIFFDSIVLDLMEALNVDENTRQQNHANLE